MGLSRTQQTELGLLPADWGVTTLGQVCVFENGDRGANYPPPGSFVPMGIPFVNAGHVSEGRIYIDKMDYITQERFALLGGGKYRTGDILFCLRGSLGKFGVVDERLTDGAIASSLVIVRPKSRLVLRQFLECYFASTACSRMIEKWAGGAAQPNLGAQDLAQFTLPLPPLPEQRAIAAALSDADALISGLDRLIAKKRDLRQAAMQQLLTGQTRLPGFSDKWETKRLGDHVAFLRNGTHSRAELEEAGPLRYLHYGDIHTASSCVLDAERTAMPRLVETKARTLDRLESGDVVFVDASEDLEGVGKAVELRVPAKMQVVAGLHTIAARFDKVILADGFKAYLQFVPAFRKHLTRLAAGTKVYATSRRHIADATIPLPSAAEQSAVAAALSDMEAEHTALEQRRDKTRLLKQGMMQELLTGRTRLA